MNEIYCRLKDLESPDIIQDIFTEALEVPGYYGRNLDALYDVLTDLSDETKVILDFNDCNEEELPDAAVQLLRVLYDAAEENDSLILEEV